MSGRLSILLLSALLGLATVAVYSPTFSADFVDIDDADYVPENAAVKAGLGAEGLRWAFTGAHAGNWFPLTWLSHMADVQLFGVDAAGHHAMNVALHVVNALLLFWGLAAITREPAPSFLVAAVFALHPVNVESVAWVSQRKTTLSTLFGLLAIGGYARWARTRDRLAYGASLAAYALSLLSKQTFVPLPFALLLLDWWPLRRRELEPHPGEPPTATSLARGWLRLAPEKVPYLLLAIAASVAALAAQGEAIATGETFPFAIRLGNAVLSTLRYVGVLLWPANLAVFYPLREEAVTVLRVGAAAVVLLALTVTLLRFGLRRRPLLVGWLWYLGFLVPVIGIVQVGAQAMADRYAYVPEWGVLAALVFPAWEATRGPRARAAVRRAIGACAGAALLVLAALAWRQAARWHDSLALFESAIAADGTNFVAHRALAGQYFNRGDFARALHHAEEGLKHPREIGEILPIYGMALFQTGDAVRAVEVLEESTRVAPRNLIGYTNLAWVQLQLGDPARSAEVLNAALAVDPSDLRATKLLAQTQLLRNDLDGAETTLARVVELAPLDFDARVDRARTAMRRGRPADAEGILRDALAAARAWDHADATRLESTLRLYLGDLLVAQGEVRRGAAEYELALSAWPDNYAANLKLSGLLAGAADPELRDPARAEQLAARARALERGVPQTPAAGAPEREPQAEAR